MLKRQIELRHLLGCLVLLFMILALLASDGRGQEIGTRTEANLLPPTTGDALTVTPNNMPDVSCSVLQWNGDPPKPTLTIVCPPEGTFAPLHVFLRLSWLKSEDVPLSVRSIAVPAKTLTRIHTNRSATWVWLEVLERDDTPARRTWVAFNGVVDVALLTLPRKR